MINFKKTSTSKTPLAEAFGQYFDPVDLQSFADVEIICKDGTVKGHSLFLSAFSPILRACMDLDDLTLFLKDFNKSEVEALMEIIYGVRDLQDQFSEVKGVLELIRCLQFSSKNVEDNKDVILKRSSPKKRKSRKQTEDPKSKRIKQEELDTSANTAEQPRKIEERREQTKIRFNSIREMEAYDYKIALSPQHDDLLTDARSKRKVCPVLDCDYAHFNRDYVLNHVNLVHRRLKCTECGVRLPRKDLPWHMVNEHPQSSNGDATFTVDLGQGEFKYRLDSEKRILCPMKGCPYKSEALRNIEDHLKFHKKEKCPYCGKLEPKTLITKHVEKFHKQPKDTTIQHSQVQAQKQFELSEHIQLPVVGEAFQIVPGADQQRATFVVFRCGACGNEFPDQESLIQHGLSAHLNQRTTGVQPSKEKSLLKCKFCSKTSDNAEYMAYHVNSCEKRKPKEIEYPEVQQMVVITELKEDDRSSSKPEEDTENKTEPECQICKKKFQSDFRLKRHSQRNHKDALFSCDHCDKVYGNKESLKKHSDVKHKLLES